MNPYVTGAAIRTLREKKAMTQAELAERLNLSDKTVSKWETGKGYPDITLLEPLARVFGVSVAELLNGAAVVNRNVSANLLRSKFYVCPVCGNVISSLGELALSCHGVNLTPCEAEQPDPGHTPEITRVEDDYYIRLDHDMTKSHYISFLAGVCSDRVELVKLYPEGGAEARFPIRGLRRLYWYCNRDGLFYKDLR